MDFFSDRLAFRKITSTDLPLYIGMTSNADVMKYITGRTLSRKETRQRLAVMTDTNKNSLHSGFYLVYENSSGAFIGLSKLVLLENGIAEIGYSLLPEYWGKRYATEIAVHFINRVTAVAPVTTVIAVVNPGNTASKKLLARLGFRWLETGFVNGLPTEIHKLDIHKS